MNLHKNHNSLTQQDFFFAHSIFLQVYFHFGNINIKDQRDGFFATTVATDVWTLKILLVDSLHISSPISLLPSMSILRAVSFCILSKLLQMFVAKQGYHCAQFTTCGFLCNCLKLFASERPAIYIFG